MRCVTRRSSLRAALKTARSDAVCPLQQRPSPKIFHLAKIFGSYQKCLHFWRGPGLTISPHGTKMTIFVSFLVQKWPNPKFLTRDRFIDRPRVKNGHGLGPGSFKDPRPDPCPFLAKSEAQTEPKSQPLCAILDKIAHPKKYLVTADLHFLESTGCARQFYQPFLTKIGVKNPCFLSKSP